ncbi:MAG: hypothetical protein ABIT09_07390 [Croceibacterium sp.]
MKTIFAANVRFPLVANNRESCLMLLFEVVDMQGLANEVPELCASPPPRRPRRTHRKLHGYFVAFALIFATLVLTGFSRTFLIPIARGKLFKPPIVHVHGALFFAWTFLLVTQAVLAATKRLRAHRTIGSIGGWLVLPMLALGTIVSARDTVNDFRSGDSEALSFFYGELADLAIFGLLAGAAMLLRKKPEHHKRLVLLGSLGLLGAAMGRIHEIDGWQQSVFFALVASVVGYDIASRRNLHWATVVGAAVLLGISLTEEWIGKTAMWLSTAHHLLKV